MKKIASISFLFILTILLSWCSIAIKTNKDLEEERANRQQKNTVIDWLNQQLSWLNEQIIWLEQKINDLETENATLKNKTTTQQKKTTTAPKQQEADNCPNWDETISRYDWKCCPWNMSIIDWSCSYHSA